MTVSDIGSSFQVHVKLYREQTHLYFEL